MLDRAAARRRPGRVRRSRRRRSAPRRSRSAAPRPPGPRCARRRRRRARWARGPRPRIVPSASATTPRVLVAPMSRPTLMVVGHRSHPVSISSSVTAARAGRESPRVQILGSAAGVRAGPAPLDHDRRPARSATSASSAPYVRVAVRVAHLDDQRPAGGCAGERARSRARRRGRQAAPRARRRRRCWPAVSTRDHHGAAPSRGSSPSTRDRRAGAGQLRLGHVEPAWRPAGRGGSSPAIRSAASTSRSSGSRPDRTAATIAACTSRTSADVLVGAEAEQVGAGEQGQHGRLGDAAAAGGAGHVEGVGDDDAVEAELLAQQRTAPCGLRVAGSSGSSAGTTMWEVITAATPASDGRRERHQLARGQGRRRRRRRPAARGGCPGRCRRGPGSAWRRRRRRPPAGPITQAATCAATSAGSDAEAAGADHRVVGVAC